jgi:DNA-binding SARP family transcriptional activator
VADGWAELHWRGRGGRLGAELKGQAGDDQGQGNGQGGQQGQAAPDQHPAEPAAGLSAECRWVELHGDLLSWTVLRRWQRLLVRSSVVRPGGRLVVAGWQRGGSAGPRGRLALSGGCLEDYAPGMRFGVLGPLEVEADDGPVVLGGPKERLLLALLLTRPNQVVSVDALVRGLWGEQPPATAAKTLQSHIKRLRRVLEPDRARGAAGQVLITRPPGYLLRVEPGTLDATRFEELTAKAARALADGAARAAGSMLREALGLWRGQAFEEFADSDVAAAEADRLGELRLGAVEDRLEAELRLGRHRELVAELESLIRKYPLRERLWAQLMLALYRAGRQADALWPTSGPGQSWSRSWASIQARSCAGSTRPSSLRIQGWTCRRRPRRARPGNSRRR